MYLHRLEVSSHTCLVPTSQSTCGRTEAATQSHICPVSAVRQPTVCQAVGSGLGACLLAHEHYLAGAHKQDGSASACRMKHAVIQLLHGQAQDHLS